MLSVISTVYDTVMVEGHRSKHKIDSFFFVFFINFISDRIMFSFSIQNNVKQIFSTSSRPSDILSLHGIRFINLMFLLFCHKSMDLNFRPITNKTEMNFLFLAPISIAFRCCYLYTDVFLMLSGLLASYSLFGKLQKGQKINVFKEIIGRYLRFMPLIAVLILFSIFILPLLGSGPLWNRSITYQSELCKLTYWRSLLMIHNWFGFENICMENTHHVGSDFQLYVATIFLIILVHMTHKFGLFIVIIMAVASAIARFQVVYARELVIFITNGAK